MKRPTQEVAGGPKVRDPSPQVAGQPIARRVTDVGSYCHVLQDPMSNAEDDAALIDDFADFLSDDGGFDAERVPAPDPVFMERLRRRLWRHYVVSHLRNVGKETH